MLVGSSTPPRASGRRLASDGAQVERRTRLGPPGVDVERFAPHEPRAGRGGDARAAASGCGAALPASREEQSSAFARDEPEVADGARARSWIGTRRARGVRGQADREQGRRPADRRLAARLARCPTRGLRSSASAPIARAWSACLRGFAEGDLEGARRDRLPWASLGGSRSGECTRDRRQATPLRHLLAFLDSLSGAEARALSGGRRALGERVVFTGRLDHEELADLLPACEALVVPSTFPEAFGMVAVEAAACGVLPVSAAHSGLAEVSEAIAAAVPSRGGRVALVSARRRRRAGDRRAGHRLAGGRRALKARRASALVSVARERWSWEGVARGVIAAARRRARRPALWIEFAR